ncbi:hypothetical protein EOS93_23190 [Rhizobium sp. RMa-01]|uniref:hypothetical protein n=1 Tax=unclassified Rhizobium TaxID=2613769 RepID=UPI0009170425|nr:MULTISPECIES: hypothetical protein [unclassified Rhizobium]OHV21425.1 hypothetical protein BBJ66_31175 [Rhizobium sp. RSm-3]RVU08818.1 hypothetical protein EOS93_23190 [Rhizobium sp. RMa-01]
MRVWTKRIIGAAVLGIIGYGAYDYYRAGFWTRPEMPDGAFSLSYKNGLRGILVGVPNEKETRRYFGYPREVPFYLKDAWSVCSPPDDTEKTSAAEFIKIRNQPGERFEAICRIKADNDVVVRGVITSVPRL